MSAHDDPQERAFSRKQAKANKLDRTMRELAVRGLLSSVEGRSYLWWLLEITRYGVNPFAADAERTAFNCGEYNVGLQILAHILEVDPAGFIRLQQEKQDAARSRSKPEPDDADNASAEPATAIDSE